MNGTVSNNAQWARKDFNRQHQEGGRVALKFVLNGAWSATASYDYQRQAALGAWDQDPLNYGTRTVSRFGPEKLDFEARIGQLHIDGDVGIADIMFASTYWALPSRRLDEYSQYEQNVNFGTATHPGYPGTQEGFTCLSDPFYGGTPFTGCNVPLQFYEYHTNPERWSNELRLSSRAGGRFHWGLGAY
ncbi:MAG TPA: hypothetical protein VEY89_10145 [Candidatus Dormibacteraeota bacterium]|nr:hypothetical protein [Candidatus Dormibacteraeota bacterium]